MTLILNPEDEELGHFFVNSGEMLVSDPKIGLTEEMVDLATVVDVAKGKYHLLGDYEPALWGKKFASITAVHGSVIHEDLLTWVNSSLYVKTSGIIGFYDYDKFPANPMVNNFYDSIADFVLQNEPYIGRYGAYVSLGREAILDLQIGLDYNKVIKGIHISFFSEEENE